MISVITPTYNTNPDILARTWSSLKAQSFSDWEWIIWDDSTSKDVWNQVYGFASDERYKIYAHRSHVHSGNIGKVKRQAFMVAEGQILVELDHDDELTPDSLSLIHGAFVENPNLGFCYSNWCEINEVGESCRYPNGWAFGFGTDYWDEHHGVWVMRAPEVNQTTMRHIVSMPNHVRAWSANAYRELNGHDASLPVADDYDLVLRTLLQYEYKHIDQMLYKQHINSGTAQRVRNNDIQRLVLEIAQKYNSEIDKMWS